jgi:hypothetical protein
LQKKLLGVLLSVFLVGGVLVVGAVPSSAATNGDIRSFLPDQAPANGNVLSDRFDGTDSQAHLTAVATAAVDRVDWLICPVGADTADGTGTAGIIDQSELAQCDLEAGSDSTPKSPTGGTLFAASDEAYDIKYDIPNQLDIQVRDVLVLGCIGEGRNVGGAGSTGTQNCVQELVEGTIFDDSEGGTVGQTSAGEMIQICTADTLATGGPGSGAGDFCQVGGAGAGSRGAVDARFRTWEHGDPVPNDGFVLRATTDPQTTALSLNLDHTGTGAEPNDGPDSNDSPDAATAGPLACTPLDTFTTRTVWECVAGASGTTCTSLRRRLASLPRSGLTSSEARPIPTSTRPRAVRRPTQRTQTH